MAPGSKVRFQFEGKMLTGTVNRITRRATVLVADKEHDGKRRLEHEQRGADPRPLIGVLARAGPDRDREIRPAGVERRHQSGQQRGEQRDGAEKEERAAIGEDARRKVRRQEERAQACAAPLGDEQPRAAAERGQNQAFDEQLPKQSRARDAQRQPHRDLASPAHGAGEQQIRDVRAGDEQDHQRDPADPRRHA